MPNENENKSALKNLTGQLVVAGLQWLLREAPGAYLTIKNLIAKPNPNDADFEASKAQITKDTYGSIVSNSQLPAA